MTEIRKANFSRTSIYECAFARVIYLSRRYAIGAISQNHLRGTEKLLSEAKLACSGWLQCVKRSVPR